MSDLLWQLGAMETAELISKKDVSTREVIKNHLERLKAVSYTHLTLPTKA